MNLAFHLAHATSIVLFMGYGLLCLLGDGMVEEFERYGLSSYRRLTGGLEVLGAAGLGVGYLFPSVGLLSAVGLALLMVLGLGVRVKVRDPLLEMVPAAFLCGVNSFLAWSYLAGPA
jgi:hypothetical protein